MVDKNLPQYRNSIYLDGYTYRLSLRLYEGKRSVAIAVPHSHPQYELHAVFAGEVILEQEGLSSVVLHAGDCCLVPPMLYHLRRFATDTTKCCALYIDCPKGSSIHLASRQCVNLACAPMLLSCLNALERELANRQVGADSSIQCLLTLLLIGIIRELNQLSPKGFSIKGTSGSLQREDAIDNYFANHYHQEISARDLAAHLGITTRQLSRIMQQRYGCTFRQHLLDIRFYHARQLLANSEETILQIANACGFTCQGAFATAFRKMIGCTPSEYRQQQKIFIKIRRHFVLTDMKSEKMSVNLLSESQ